MQAKLLRLLGNLLLLQLVLRLVLGFRNRQLATLQLGFLLKPLGLQAQLLHGNAILLKSTGLLLVKRHPKLLGLLRQPLALNADLRLILGLLNRKGPPLQLRLLLQFLCPKPQLLLRHPKLLHPRHLLFGQRRPELLALGLQTGFLNGQLTPLESGFLLELLGAKIDFLLLDTQPADPQRPLQFLLDIELPLAFAKLCATQALLKLRGLPHAVRLELRQVLRAGQLRKGSTRLHRREAILRLRLRRLLKQACINVGQSTALCAEELAESSGSNRGCRQAATRQVLVQLPLLLVKLVLEVGRLGPTNLLERGGIEPRRLGQLLLQGLEHLRPRLIGLLTAPELLKGTGLRQGRTGGGLLGLAQIERSTRR